LRPLGGVRSRGPFFVLQLILSFSQAPGWLAVARALSCASPVSRFSEWSRRITVYHCNLLSLAMSRLSAGFAESQVSVTDFARPPEGLRRKILDALARNFGGRAIFACVGVSHSTGKAPAPDILWEWAVTEVVKPARSTGRGPDATAIPSPNRDEPRAPLTHFESPYLANIGRCASMLKARVNRQWLRDLGFF